MTMKRKQTEKETSAGTRPSEGGALSIVPFLLAPQQRCGQTPNRTRAGRVTRGLSVQHPGKLMSFSDVGEGFRDRRGRVVCAANNSDSCWTGLQLSKFIICLKSYGRAGRQARPRRSSPRFQPVSVERQQSINTPAAFGRPGVKHSIECNAQPGPSRISEPERGNADQFCVMKMRLSLCEQ